MSDEHQRHHAPQRAQQHPADQEGEFAWVLTRSETSGTFRDKEIAILGVETMLLRDTPTGWKIFHIHWSSRAKKEK